MENVSSAHSIKVGMDGHIFKSNLLNQTKNFTGYFHHAPARLRVAANMFALACGYAAVCLLVPLRSAEGATQAGCGLD